VIKTVVCESEMTRPASRKEKNANAKKVEAAERACCVMSQEGGSEKRLYNMSGRIAVCATIPSYSLLCRSPNQTTVWTMTVRTQNNGHERRGQPHNGERLHSETGGPGVTKTVSQRKASSFAGLTQVHHASSPERAGRGSRRLEVYKVSLAAFRRSFVSLAHWAVDWLRAESLSGPHDHPDPCVWECVASPPPQPLRMLTDWLTARFLGRPSFAVSMLASTAAVDRA
jgi:hypothetical protein